MTVFLYSIVAVSKSNVCISHEPSRLQWVTVIVGAVQYALVCWAKRLMRYVDTSTTNAIWAFSVSGHDWLYARATLNLKPPILVLCRPKWDFLKPLYRLCSWNLNIGFTSFPPFVRSGACCRAVTLCAWSVSWSWLEERTTPSGRSEEAARRGSPALSAASPSSPLRSTPSDPPSLNTWSVATLFNSFVCVCLCVVL